MKLSNRARLILILGIILAFSFMSVSLLNVNTARSAIIDEVSRSSLPLLRENILSEIQSDLLPALNIASLMSNDYFLIRWTDEGEMDEGQVRAYLQRIQSEYGFFSTFFVSETTKNYYHFTGINKVISEEDDHDSWYFDFIDSGDAYNLDVDTDEARNNLLTIFINYRLEDSQGRLIGVTGVGIEMESFSNFLQEKQNKYNRNIFLTDEEGLIQAHSELNRIDETNIYNESGISFVADQILSNKTTPLDLQYHIKGEEILISSRFIPEINWFLIVELRNAQKLGNSGGIMLRSTAIGLSASIIIVILVSTVITGFNRKLEVTASTDPLTGLANRREFNIQLEKMIYRKKRYRTPGSLILIDVDHFKQINDTYGHQSGDEILIRISKGLDSIKRPDDVLARWGGDEFIILLEQNISQAESLAQRLLSSMREKMSDKNVTLSLGISELNDDENAESLLRRADQAMYKAKEGGRDRFMSST